MRGLRLQVSEPRNPPQVHKYWRRFVSKARQLPTPARRKRIGPVDVRVAATLRERRMALGLTLDEVATSIGLTAQQIHKYESAQNRIPAGRLNMLSQALGLPLAEFFDERPASPLPVSREEQLTQFAIVRLLRQVPDLEDQRLILSVVESIVSQLQRRTSGSG
ncbi:MAG: helix-turn-helix transcriptional regulator [Hyphomicrobiaceae bacterium]